MRVESHAVLSTGHLSLQTREWLNKLDWEKEGPAGGPTNSGFFIYAADDNDCCIGSPAHAPDGEFPADLWATFEAARKRGVSYIDFDLNEDACDDLPTYDDHPAVVDTNGHLVPGTQVDVIESRDGTYFVREAYRESEETTVATLARAMAQARKLGATVRRVLDNIGNEIPFERGAA